MFSLKNCASKKEISEKMNKLGKLHIPFLFIINFDLSEASILPLSEINHDEILYSFEGNNNDENIFKTKQIKDSEALFKKFPISENEYKNAFDKVQFHISYGDTYLLNLTFQTKVETSLELSDFYSISKSKYKLYVKENFVSFSPEPFVKIEDGIISTYPMKGTISSSVQNAEENLMNNKKEIAEHYTIVDLLRNDLSIIAKKVRVENFRYIEKIKTNFGEILQTSTKISGELNGEWQSEIGTILTSILPAGSVTGAPKKKTVEIIKNIEDYKRGYYTGVAGIFDGIRLDSCVLIRFIEKTKNGFYFKTGGGITSKSNHKNEYEEMLEKIYVPTI